MEWLPIDTAPKDGTEVVATDGEYCETTTCISGTWVYGCCCLDWNPTHWMPLPEPPTSD